MSSLDIIKIGPFEVIEKIDEYTLCLQPPESFRFHSVISAICLELAVADPYQRTPAVDGEVVKTADDSLVLESQLREDISETVEAWEHRFGIHRTTRSSLQPTKVRV